MPKPPVPPGKAKNSEATAMTINEGQYCLVDNPATPTTVLQGPQQLPQNWESYYNINNSDIWDDAALRSIGWWPYMLIDAGSPGYGYTRSLGPFVFTATHCTQDAVYTQQDIEIVRRRKIQELETQVIQYNANEIAVDELLAENIRMEQEWVETESVILAKETDFNVVQNFDTTKPATLPVANNYVGARYVSQGLKMQNQNDSAISAGLTEPWDQVKLNAFIAANELAAQDVTGGTAPVAADFSLRQGSVTPADSGGSSLIVYRSERLYDGRQNPEPSLELILTNKQDARPLYCFIQLQTGGNLEWVEFTDAGDGTWRANSSVNIITWVNSDLQLILSYGTNVAVQQDYFTNPILFDAGGEQIIIRVRWDVE